MLKDYKGAIEDFNKVIKDYPKDGRAFIERGDLKVELKDYMGAIADYKKADSLGNKDAKIKLKNVNKRFYIK